MLKTNLKNIKKAGLVLFGLWLFLFFAFAILLFSDSKASASVSDLKNSLQQDLQKIEAQINEYRAKISESQSQAKTLNREIKLLTDKIKELELQIKQTDIVLQQTNLSIDEKTAEIGGQEEKLSRERTLLAEYLQGIYEFDQESMVELIFSQNSLSDIFGEMNALDIVQKKTQDTIANINKIKIELEAQKQDLTDKKDEQIELKNLQEAQKVSSRSQQSEKNTLLKRTKGEEAEYQKMLKQAKSDATAIKKQIYLLEGVGLSMTLEEAYKHAKFASDLAGIRPAFLLAVLKQESSWGTNVGTGTWRKDMAKRDQDAFMQITDELNLDPDKMPVSKKPSYGWGGAMGPAQFLPSTWLGYKNDVARLTSHNPPSPWDIDDAFTAAALKLANGGAVQKNNDAEWQAAMVYFAGNNWGKKIYSFYGDAVMDLADTIQQQLDIIAGN